MMKKLALFLALVSVFALVSCSPKKTDGKTEKDTTKETVITEDTTVVPETTGSEESTYADETTSQKEDDTTFADTSEKADTTKKEETSKAPSKEEPFVNTPSGIGTVMIDPSKPKPEGTQTEAPAQPEAPKAPYESITCVEATGTKIVHLAKEEHNEAVSVHIPNDWTLSGNKSEGYTVYRSSLKIGTVTFATGLSHSGCEKCESFSRFGITLNSCVLKNARSYVRRLLFTNKAGDMIVLTVDYKYLSASSMSKIINTMRSNLLYSDPALGSTPPSEGNGKKSILILGNSFVQTSQIGDFLGSMIAGGNKLYKVNAVSRGYYTLSSYVQDPDTMDSIRNGNYGFVFICGIYSFNEVYDLKYMVEACKESNTTLVVFPAHNESAEFIADAKKQYYNVHFLDWKREIDMLIGTGVDWDAFCIDDQHKHSKPLAGYVGAHMIYRSIFGEIPPSVGSSVSGCSQTYIDSMLGDYVRLGGIPNFPDNEIYMF
ncbi:MAG: hypothetical protein IJA52_02650 [Clostridia bacterium]|nr:hypothetical protein [Clostridia bacterium]